MTFRKTASLGMILLLATLTVSPTVTASDEWASVAVLNPITGKSVYPGDTVDFSITVESGHNRTEDGWCSLNVESMPAGWDVGFYDNNTRITNLFFAAGETEPMAITLRVKTPADISNGDYAVWVRFRPDEGHSILREFVVNVNTDAEPSIDLFSETPGLETSSADYVRFPITLRNNYDHRVTVDLFAENVPTGWDVDFFYESDGTYRLKKLSVAAGTEQSFTMRVRPALNETDGVYIFTARAVPENGDRGVPLNFSVAVNNGLSDENMLLVSAAVNRILLNPGASEDVTVTVRNTGDKTLNNVKLNVQTPSGLSANINSFGNIKELRPGETWSTTIEITARADAGSGTKDVLIRAVSDETQSEDAKIEAAVEKSGTSSLIGIGLIAAAVLFLAVVFLKFGRR